MWGQFWSIQLATIISPMLLTLVFFRSYIYIIFHKVNNTLCQEHIPSLQWFFSSLNSYPLPMYMGGLIPRSHVCAMWINSNVS